MIISNMKTAARLILLVALVAVAAPAAQAQGTGVDAEAGWLLRRMTEYLAGLPQFSVDAQSALEVVLTSGQKVQFVMEASAMVRRPNKLRAERVGGLVDQVFYYDGKTLTLYSPADKVYATVPAPDTIEGTLDYARDRLDIIAPAGDLLYRNAFDLLMQATTSGIVVGKAMIGGVKCDHLAFRGPEVDWQVWIADGDQPLPRRYVVTTKDLASHPQFTAVLTNWNVSPNLGDASFTFTPPAGAKPIDFLKREAGSTPAR
jgi:hypothetical protein